MAKVTVPNVVVNRGNKPTKAAKPKAAKPSPKKKAAGKRKAGKKAAKPVKQSARAVIRSGPPGMK